MQQRATSLRQSLYAPPDGERSARRERQTHPLYRHPRLKNTETWPTLCLRQVYPRPSQLIPLTGSYHQCGPSWDTPHRGFSPVTYKSHECRTRGISALVCDADQVGVLTLSCVRQGEPCSMPALAGVDESHPNDDYLITSVFCFNELTNTANLGRRDS